MKPTLTNRSLMAWLLYFSVLFNVLACGIGHGQLLGLSLNGVGGAFCSADNSAGPTLDSGSGSVNDASATTPFSCPLCGAVGLGLALLFCLSWLLPARRDRLPAWEPQRKAPPRYSWPSANPRASPF
ncbi:hypothetical protein ACVW0Y_002135 [Pseudomonas sp. TE3786]